MGSRRDRRPFGSPVFGAAPAILEWIALPPEKRPVSETPVSLLDRLADRPDADL
jgi:hypothetical protein